MSENPKPIWRLEKPLYLKKTDKRYEQQLKQIKSRGFCDAELWSLDSTIAEFILPRLIEFRKELVGYPGNLTSESWAEILDKMIWSFENLEDLDWPDGKDEEYNRKFQEGLELFGKYFRDLWN